MRRIAATTALAALLAGVMVAPAGAQDGIVIQNNGVDSSQSAAGADNVNVSLAPGNSSSTNGAGLNNDVGAVVNERERKERKERKPRNNTEELAAPVEEPAPAPAEGDLQAYGEGESWVEPAPEGIAGEQVTDANAPIQLPNTGVGFDLAGTVGVLASALGAIGLCTEAVRRRLFS